MQNPDGKRNADGRGSIRRRTFRLILGACAALVIAYVVLSNVSGVTGTAPMLAMPVVVARDGVLVRAGEIRSFQYQFAETKTSFEKMQ
jgi:hypothetical protein